MFIAIERTLNEVTLVTCIDPVHVQKDENIRHVEVGIPAGLAAYVNAQAQVGLEQRRDVRLHRGIRIQNGERQAWRDTHRLGRKVLLAGSGHNRMGLITAVLQSVIPPAMQGRVFSLKASLLTATVPVGLAVAGPVSDAVGVRVWFLGAGSVVALMAIVTFFIPAVMQIEATAVSGAIEAEESR